MPWDGPVYMCALFLDGRVEASLCGIAMPGMDDPYRRVVEAELALEAGL